MCYTYYSSADVERVSTARTETMRDDPDAVAALYMAAERLIKPELSKIAFASLSAGGGNPIETLRTAITAGFVLGLDLAGKTRFIDTTEQESNVAEFRGQEQAQVNEQEPVYA